MSSKKNAAKKAAADAAKAASKESTKVETKVENKKEEKVNAPQVAAPAATAKKEEAPKAPAPTPKKEEKKQEPKAEAKTSDKQTAQKGTAQQEKPKAKSKVPTVIAEEVDATALGRQLGIPIDGAVKSSQSSTDAKAMLRNNILKSMLKQHKQLTLYGCWQWLKLRMSSLNVPIAVSSSYRSLRIRSFRSTKQLK